MTVRNRVTLGFGIILIFVLGATVVAVYGARVIESRVERLREEETSSTIEMMRLEQDILRIKSDLFAASSVGSPTLATPHLESARGAYDSAQGRLVGLTATLRESNAVEARSAIERIQREIAEFYAIGTSMAQSYAIAGIEEGNSEKTRFEPYVQRMENNLNTVVELRQDQMETSFSQILSVGAQTVLGTLVAGGAALLTVLFVLVGVHRSLSRPLATLLDRSGRIAEGDLTVEIDQRGNDEIGLIGTQIGQIASRLDGLVCTVRANLDLLRDNTEALAKALGESSGEVSRITEAVGEVHGAGERQQGLVEDTSSAVEQIARSIESLDRSIQEQASQVESAASAVEETLRSIETIGGTIENAKSVVEALGERSAEGLQRVETVSQRVHEIVARSGDLEKANEIISSVAARTNLLAMNAAIEAAHAGESGRGFAVVAGEIRSLAEETANQSTSVAQNLGAMGSAISQAEAGASRNKEIFGSIQESVTEVSRVIGELSGAVEEQRSGNDQVRGALGAMRQESAEVKVGSQEMAAGNRRILTATDSLKTISQDVAERIRAIREAASSIDGRVADLSRIADENVTHIQKVVEDARKFHVSLDVAGCADSGEAENREVTWSHIT